MDVVPNMTPIALFLLLWTLFSTKYVLLGHGKHHNPISQYCIEFLCVNYIVFHSYYEHHDMNSIFSHLLLWIFYGVFNSKEGYSVLTEEFTNTTNMDVLTDEIIDNHNILKDSFQWIETHKILMSSIFVTSIVAIVCIYRAGIYLLGDRYHRFRKYRRTLTTKNTLIRVLLLSYLNLTALSIYQLFHSDDAHIGLTFIATTLLFFVSIGAPLYLERTLYNDRNTLCSESVYKEYKALYSMFILPRYWFMSTFWATSTLFALCINLYQYPVIVNSIQMGIVCVQSGLVYKYSPFHKKSDVMVYTLCSLALFLLCGLNFIQLYDNSIQSIRLYQYGIQSVVMILLGCGYVYNRLHKPRTTSSTNEIEIM